MRLTPDALASTIKRVRLLGMTSRVDDALLDLADRIDAAIKLCNDIAARDRLVDNHDGPGVVAAMRIRKTLEGGAT